MRRFSAGYLERTRAGMWEDSVAALEGLELPTRRRILDVGCGTGELTAVLRAESPATVVACDVDRALLEHVGGPCLLGDALALPVQTDGVDLVTCQALLINLSDPVGALEEFARVSSDRVAVVEPDNGAVTVDSSVAAESALEETARRAYLAGVETDVTLGADAAPLLERAGLSVLETARYDHERVIEPPYDEDDVRDTRRKATGAGLAEDEATMLAGGLTRTEYEALRSDWRAMGRAVAEAMAEGTYRRREVVPFHVTVGQV